MSHRPPPAQLELPPLTVCLETPRLRLRGPRPSDVAALRAHLRRSADHLRPFTPAPRVGEDPTSLTALSRLVVRQRREWRRGHGFAFLATTREGDMDLVARVTLTRVARGALQEAHLGYAVDVDHTGRGYATEAVAAVLGFAFKELQLHRVQAAVMPNNTRSLRVLEKLGFRDEGMAKEYLFIAGQWEDHVILAITEDEHARRTN